LPTIKTVSDWLAVT